MIPDPDDTIRIQAQVRWLTGWPHMILALEGFWVEAPITMNLPLNLGSPGLQNSRFAANAGPAIGDVTHAPLLPAGGEAVVVTASVHDPDGVVSATLKYRVVPSGTFTDVPMLDDSTGGDRMDGDGIYSGTIPAQAASTRVAFKVEVTDAAGPSATTHFPGDALPGAPALECVIRFGQDVRAGSLASYILWMTDAAANRWSSLPGGRFSNEPNDATFVYAPYRAIYNVGARWRGARRTGYNSPVFDGAYSVELPKAERFVGQAEFKIDQPGQNGSDATRVNEYYSLWLARVIDVPASQLRFVHVYVNHNYRGLHHDYQVPSTDFSVSWFNDDDPQVFKEVGSAGEPFDTYTDGFGEPKLARYRWHWRKRRPAKPNDDFTTIFKLAENLEVATQAVSTPIPDVEARRIEAVVDIRNWAGYMTGNRAVGGWDYYRHNVYAYAPYDKRASLLLYDMDHVMQPGQTPGIFPTPGLFIPSRMFNTHPPFRRICYTVAKELVNGPLQPGQTGPFMDTWYNALLANNAVVSAPTDRKNYMASAFSTVQGMVNSVASPFFNLEQQLLDDEPHHHAFRYNAGRSQQHSNQWHRERGQVHGSQRLDSGRGTAGRHQCTDCVRVRLAR